MSPSATSTCPMSPSGVGDSILALGNFFQGFITLSVKKCFLIANLNFHVALKALLAAENWRGTLVKGGKAISSVPLKKPGAWGGGGVVGSLCLDTVFLPTAALLNPVQLGG